MLGTSLQGWAGPGRGRERRARGAAVRTCAASRTLGLSAGALGSRGAGREPPGLGGAAPAGWGGGASAPRGGRWPQQRAASRPHQALGSVPGSQCRARDPSVCALPSPLRLRPLLDVSSRSRRGRLIFPFLLRQGSKEPRGEASPCTFKGTVAVGTRGAQ